MMISEVSDGQTGFTPELKDEAVKLVKERGVSVRQASPDLGLHETVLRKWVRTRGLSHSPPRCCRYCVQGDAPRPIVIDADVTIAEVIPPLPETHSTSRSLNGI